MKFYQTVDKSKWIIALNGGIFENFNQAPYALICDGDPRPKRRWTTPTEVIDRDIPLEMRRIDYSFLEYQAGNNFIYMLIVENFIMFPTVRGGYAEFFVDKEYLDEKINKLKAKKCLNTYLWNPNECTWDVEELLFEYES